MSHSIPYEEFRAINKVLDAHSASYGDRLCAAVAFGGLLTGGLSYDIDLLEVIEGWDSSHGRIGIYESSPELPLRGQLRLYILTPEEFADPQSIADEMERRWVRDLLAQVLQGYDILQESPLGFAQRVLTPGQWISTLNPPPSGRIKDFELLRPVTSAPPAR